MTTPATLALGLRSTAQSLGVVGRALGLFEAEGIDLQVVREETAGPDGIRGLVAGDFEFAELGTVPLVEAALEGADPVVLLAAEPVSALYVLGRAGIERPGQLAGGRIGVLSVAGQTGASALRMAGRWDLAPDVRLAPLGTYGAISEALATGRIDAGVLTADYRIAGQLRFGWNELADLGREFGYQGPVLATTRRFTATQPRRVQAVVHGYVASLRAFLRGGEAVVTALQRHLRFVDASEAAAVHRFYAARFSPEPAASDDGIGRVIRSFLATVPRAATLTPADVHEPRFLRVALQRG